MTVDPMPHPCPRCEVTVRRVHGPGLSSYLVLDWLTYDVGFTLREHPGGALEAVPTSTYRAHECDPAAVEEVRARRAAKRERYDQYLAENGYQEPFDDEWALAREVPCPFPGCGAEIGEVCFNASKHLQGQKIPKKTPHPRRVTEAYQARGFLPFFDPTFMRALLRPVETPSPEPGPGPEK